MANGLANVVREVDQFLMGVSKVQLTLERIAQRLSELGIDFAVAGALAVGARGHLRLTIDVDLLVTAEGFTRFRERWLGRGYVEVVEGSRGVRDTETGVAIDFLIAGEFPGDGLPKAIRFPHPTSISKEAEPFRVMDLRTLVELKLASGMTSPDRLQDLADVLALIRVNALSASFAEDLDPSVHQKYAELWQAAQRPIQR